MGLIHIGDLHKHAFYPSYTEFVYSGCWHFEKGATCKIDDVPIEHGVLHYVLPFAVQFPPDFFFWWPSRRVYSKPFSTIKR